MAAGFEAKIATYVAFRLGIIFSKILRYTGLRKEPITENALMLLRALDKR